MEKDEPLPVHQAQFLNAQADDELWPWIYAIDSRNAGDFLNNIADAARRADTDNYRLMRPLLLELRNKYPEYHQRGLSLFGSRIVL